MSCTQERLRETLDGIQGLTVPLKDDVQLSGLMFGIHRGDGDLDGASEGAERLNHVVNRGNEREVVHVDALKVHRLVELGDIEAGADVEANSTSGIRGQDTVSVTKETLSLFQNGLEFLGSRIDHCGLRRDGDGSGERIDANFRVREHFLKTKRVRP
jgi:hypothetical protein